MFRSFFKLGVDDVWGLVQARTITNNPVEADALPTYRVYGETGDAIDTGTLAAFDSPTITGCYKYSFTPTSPAYARGKTYSVIISYEIEGEARQDNHSFILM